MTDLRKAAEMALKELDGLYPFDTPSKKALRQALAQEWVWLTKDEVDSWKLPDSPTVFEFAQFIENKLKEKNGG